MQSFGSDVQRDAFSRYGFGVRPTCVGTDLCAQMALGGVHKTISLISRLLGDRYRRYAVISASAERFMWRASQITEVEVA